MTEHIQCSDCGEEMELTDEQESLLIFISHNLPPCIDEEWMLEWLLNFLANIDQKVATALLTNVHELVQQAMTDHVAAHHLDELN